MTATLFQFIDSCTNSIPDGLHSIFYYPHPFTDGGFVFVVDENSVNFLDVSGIIYSLVPSSYSLHILRSHELDMLAAPGMFAPPLHVNEMTHLPYYLKYKGECLYGKDSRDQIPLPDSQYLLAAHI